MLEDRYHRFTEFHLQIHSISLKIAFKDISLGTMLKQLCFRKKYLFSLNLITSPNITNTDWIYYDLDPETGLFQQCQKLNLIERLVDEHAVEQAISYPPADTRARIRGTILKEAAQAVY